MATDPACGMPVTADQNSSIHLHVDGRTWWFCSTNCRDEYAVRIGAAGAGSGTE